MPALYFYVPTEKLEDVVDCGLKLSEWKTRHQATSWNRIERPCFVAWLNPNDDIRHRDERYQCVKLDVPTDYCAVADSDLYYLSLEHGELRQEYINTMVPLNDYIFGTFRLPECLVFATVLPDQIRCLGKGMDEPILYENSEVLYVNNILETYNDRYDDFNQALLYSFLTMQEQSGLVSCKRSSNRKLAVFYDRENNRRVTVKIPDFGEYLLKGSE
ncbi:MAG: hypothetical protein GX045_00235 [Clostridiaceae bacterium]|jgi:hypothetical protein|nr:hypothetical protein [Clostridiaceae bacterium]